MSIRQATGKRPALAFSGGKGAERWRGIPWPRSRCRPLPTPSTSPMTTRYRWSCWTPCAPVCGWSSPSGRATAGRRASSWRWRAGTRTTQGARAFSPFWTKSRCWTARPSGWPCGCGNAGSAPCTTRPGPCSRRGCTSPFRIAGSWPPAWTGRRPMRRRAGQSTPGASWSCSSPRGGRRM